MGVVDACGNTVAVSLVNPGTLGAFYNVTADPLTCLGGSFGAAANLCRTVAQINGQNYYYPTSPNTPNLIWIGAWHIHIIPVDPVHTTTIEQPFILLRDNTDPSTLLYVSAAGTPENPPAAAALTNAGRGRPATKAADRVPALTLGPVTDLPSAKRALDTVVRHANQLAETVRQLQAAPTPAPPLTLEQIRQALSATGSHPLNVTGLPGTLRQNQPHTTP